MSVTIKVKVKTIIVGKIIKPHGVRGGVKIKPFTETTDNFYLYDVFSIFSEREQNNNGLHLSVLKVQSLNGLVVIYFKGIDTLEQAEGLRNMLLHLPRETIVAKKKLSDNDVLIDDLLGFQVYENESYLGCVDGYYEGGVNGLYLVKIDSKPKSEKKSSVDEKDFFIPCDVDFYQNIDFYQEKIFLYPNSVVR